MKGRLLAYSRWQLMDFLRDRSFAILLVGILIGIPISTTFRAMSGPGADTFLQQMLANVTSTIVMQLTPIFTLITINKIVAGDRGHGYYRFLFAKPISVPQYYTQLFVVNGVGLLLCVTALAVGAVLWKVPIPILPMVAVFAVTYIAMGGIGFLFSVLMRFDWQPMLGLWFASLLLYERYGDSGGVAQALVHLLPPARLTSEISTALFTSHPVDGTHLLWLLGYGVVCFALGAVALRYRQLGS